MAFRNHPVLHLLYFRISSPISSANTYSCTYAKLIEITYALPKGPFHRKEIRLAIQHFEMIAVHQSIYFGDRYFLSWPQQVDSLNPLFQFSIPSFHALATSTFLATHSVH